MAKNTAITIQEALVVSANQLQPCPLDEVLRDAETRTGVPVSPVWAAEALKLRGFIVEDLADQRVVRKPGVCIDPPSA